MAKTTAGLVEYAKAQLGLPYWYGTFGAIATAELYKAKKKQYPQYYASWNDFPTQYGKRVHDCVGLIKGYLWSDTPTSTPVYNSSQDVSADGMRNKCSEKGDISTMPDIPGILVFQSGHVGIYIGNGEVIEARGHQYGVVKTKLADRGWKWWGKCPWISYSNINSSTATVSNSLYTKKIKIKSGTWNVRKFPTTDSQIVTTIKGGIEVDSSNGFTYLPTYNGWISNKAIE